MFQKYQPDSDIPKPHGNIHKLQKYQHNNGKPKTYENYRSSTTTGAKDQEQMETKREDKIIFKASIGTSGLAGFMVVIQRHNEKISRVGKFKV